MNARDELAADRGRWLGQHPALAAIREWQRELTAIRHELHANPELGFEEHFTSELVARQLARWGVDEVHRGNEVLRHDLRVGLVQAPQITTDLHVEV